MECLVLSIESEKLELRRSLNEGEGSANDGRPKGLCRGGDILGLDVVFAAGTPPPLVGEFMVFS